MSIVDSLPVSLRPAVSPYVGIVRSLEECLAATGDARHFQAAAACGSGREVIGARLDHLRGTGGAARTRGGAAAAAVGEALERYSASFVPGNRLVIATAEELGDEAVDPEAFCLFSERQHLEPGFPYRRFTSRARVAWVRGFAVPDGRSAWLPAELVFLGSARVGGEPPIAYATSSGLACAATFDEAVVHGLFELLERDAFMVTWATRLSLPLFEDDPASPLVSRREHERFAAAGFRYAAVDLSIFHGIPSVLGVVRGPSGAAGALGVGAGTSATIEEAWWKALSEAFSARAAGMKLLLPGSPASGDEVASFEDHIRFHADPRNQRSAVFLDASPARRPLASVRPLAGRSAAERIVELCGALERAGARAYAVDVSSPDVAALGLSVARVVAPGLCPLDVVQGARFLGGTRLYDCAERLGLRSAPLLETDLNPDPHPFP